MRDQRQILSTGYCWGLSPVMISGGGHQLLVGTSQLLTPYKYLSNSEIGRNTLVHTCIYVLPISFFNIFLILMS